MKTDNTKSNEPKGNYSGCKPHDLLFENLYHYDEDKMYVLCKKFVLCKERTLVKDEETEDYKDAEDGLCVSLVDICDFLFDVMRNEKDEEFFNACIGFVKKQNKKG